MTILIEDMKLDEISGNTSDKLLMNFNRNITNALDKHVPLKTAKITLRDRKA